MAARACCVEGCTEPVQARDRCHTHYMRWYREQGSSPWPSAEERFWAAVNMDGPLPDPLSLAAGKGPCWLWAGGTNGRGYGRLSYEGIPVPAHAYSYRLLVGPIPDGLMPDHLCCVKLCVNPDHLEPVTNQENGLRGAQYRRRQSDFVHQLRQIGQRELAEGVLLTSEDSRDFTVEHFAEVTMDALEVRGTHRGYVIDESGGF